MPLFPSRRPPVPAAPGPTEETGDEAFWAAHEELSRLEAERPGDPADLHMVHAFGAPREWRTMSRIDREAIQLLAGIHARGLHSRSRFRVALVENYFLMMRSADGHGAEQMVRVASARNGSPSPPSPSRGIAGWFRRGPEGPT